MRIPTNRSTIPFISKMLSSQEMTTHFTDKTFCTLVRRSSTNTEKEKQISTTFIVVEAMLSLLP